MANCKQCNIEFRIKAGTKGTYCSYSCYWLWMKGRSIRNSGQFKKGSTPTNKGVFLAKAKYNTIHRWLQRNFIKSSICGKCGKNGYTEWSNIDGNYLRKRSDYEELCASCHRFEDRKNPKNIDFSGGTLYG